MKLVLLAIILFISFFSVAQEYNCLQQRVKPFYTNGNGYLRGMRIDSISVSGSDTIYHPYHTPRGQYLYLLDSTGGSWLGKNVIKHANGAFVFDDIWHDSVVIKTQAILGDSWVFYRDTTNVSYKATVTLVDTMTIMGAIDSVKAIAIEADTNGHINSSDPVNNFEIILSKAHGFVQVFDLYTFPYHKPGNVAAGIMTYDYYLDLVEGDLACVCDMGTSPNSASTANSVFRLAPFHNPTFMELNSFSVGEVLEFNDLLSAYNGQSNTNTQTLDTILSKTTTASSVSYTMIQSSLITHIYYTGTADTTTYAFSRDTATATYDTTLLIDTTLMPEEWNVNYFYHFFPQTSYDSGKNCPEAVLVVDVNNIAYPTGQVVFEYLMGTGNGAYIGNTTKTYSLGFGLSAISMNNWTNGTGYGPWGSETASYNYIYDRDSSCGNYQSINSLTVNQVPSPTTEIHVFPNPVHDLLNINATGLLTNVVITNVIGQTLFNNGWNADKAQVDVSGFPVGIYFVKVNGGMIAKFLKQ